MVSGDGEQNEEGVINQCNPYPFHSTIPYHSTISYHSMTVPTISHSFREVFIILGVTTLIHSFHSLLTK